MRLTMYNILNIQVKYAIFLTIYFQVFSYESLYNLKNILKMCDYYAFSLWVTF